MTNYREISCKSILNKSGITGIDFALNPYIGCEHSCVYCYAVFMKRFTTHPEEWGEFVDIKINAPQILKMQLERLKSKSFISIGTVCDAYQPIEKKYQITRKILEILKYYHHYVSILTKSNLILRDIDLLRKIKEIEVGFTIATINLKVKKIFEPNSPSVQERFSAIKTLTENDIKTWVFVAPILPYIADSTDEIAELINLAQRCGAKSITFDSLNPYPKVRYNVIKMIKKNFPEHLDDYHNYYRKKTYYERQIRAAILNIASSFDIQIDFAF